MPPINSINLSEELFPRTPEGIARANQRDRERAEEEVMPLERKPALWSEIDGYGPSPPPKPDGLFAARLLGHVAGKVKKVHPEDAATRARFDSLEFEGDAEGIKPFVSDRRKRKGGKRTWTK